MYRSLFVLAVLVAVFAVGCAAPAASAPGGTGVPNDASPAPVTAETPAVTPGTGASPIATPAGGAGALPTDLATQASAWLAGEAGVSAADLRVVEAERTEWTDSCFGLGGPAESCLQAITPGWRIVFEAGGQQYEVRTDESGSSFRLAPQAS